MAEIKLKFNLRNETPGTYRYQEVAPQGEEKVGSLYVKKTTLKNGAPKSLDVAIRYEGRKE